MAERRRIIEPSQLRKRKRRRRNFKLIFWLVIVVLIFGAIVWVTHLSSLRIAEINISGNSLVRTSDLLQIIQRGISGNYWFLFSKANILLYPEEKIKTDILEENKSIDTVTIKDSSLHGIDVSVTERKPTALWCTTNAAEATSSTCYFIDQDGYVFYPASNFSGNAYFLYYGLIKADNPIGQSYLPKIAFQNLDVFLENVKKVGITAISLHASDKDDLELDLDNGARILFNTSQPFDQTLSNLQTIIDKNNPGGTGIDLSTVDYIDLRFGNKVFYRLKGSSKPLSATSSSLSI